MIIETTIYLILVPDDDPDNNADDEMLHEATFHSLHQQSKYFRFLASVFCSHVVYLVNKVCGKSLLFL